MGALLLPGSLPISPYSSTSLSALRSLTRPHYRSTILLGYLLISAYCSPFATAGIPGRIPGSISGNDIRQYSSDALLWLKERFQKVDASNRVVNHALVIDGLNLEGPSGGGHDRGGEEGEVGEKKENGVRSQLPHLNLSKIKNSTSSSSSPHIANDQSRNAPKSNALLDALFHHASRASNASSLPLNSTTPDKAPEYNPSAAANEQQERQKQQQQENSNGEGVSVQVQQGSNSDTVANSPAEERTTKELNSVSNAADMGLDLMNFDGALGGVLPPSIVMSPDSKRPFEVEGDTFVRFPRSRVRVYMYCNVRCRN